MLGRASQMLDALPSVPPLEEIPNHFIFVWYGQTLPTFAVVAIRSALSKNPDSTATLFHDPDLALGTEIANLTPQGLKLTLLDIDALTQAAQRLSPALNGEKLARIYRQLNLPAARANLVRLLALYTLGGVYLDTDTLTLRSLSTLRQSSSFIGVERILFPQGQSKFHPGALLLGELRRICALIPYAYRIEKRLHTYYSLAANNAVIGATVAHPFILELLRGVVQMPEEFVKKRFVLGTHLLQQTLAQFERASETQQPVKVYDPAFFYPLGPMISRHYFRRYSSPARVVDELVDERTHIIHWYASVAELNSRDREFIVKNAEREVFSHLCRPYLDEL